MSLFKRIPVESEPVVAPPAPPSPFRLAEDEADLRLLLLFQRPGSDQGSEALWSRQFGTRDKLQAVLACIKDEDSDIDTHLWGRLVMAFGVAALDHLVDQILEDHCERQAREKAKRQAEAEKRRRVRLFAPEERGFFSLTLERDSDDEPEWAITFRGRAERERLRDWMRWQSDRFLVFLDYAEEHGDKALEKLLIDEMFATEKRVKQEGRGAGGTRPLRMWRGE